MGNSHRHPIVQPIHPTIQPVRPNHNPHLPNRRIPPRDDYNHLHYRHNDGIHHPNNIRRYNNEISPHANFYRTNHVPRATMTNHDIFIQSSFDLLIFDERGNSLSRTEPTVTEQTFLNNHNAYVDQLLGTHTLSISSACIPYKKPNVQHASKSFYISHIEPPIDLQCSICLGDFVDDCVELNCCSHLFHKNCIDDWIKQKNGHLKPANRQVVDCCCPLCREKIE